MIILNTHISVWKSCSFERKVKFLTKILCNRLFFYLFATLYFRPEGINPIHIFSFQNWKRKEKKLPYRYCRDCAELLLQRPPLLSYWLPSSGRRQDEEIQAASRPHRPQTTHILHHLLHHFPQVSPATRLTRSIKGEILSNFGYDEFLCQFDCGHSTEEDGRNDHQRHLRQSPQPEESPRQRHHRSWLGLLPRVLGHQYCLLQHTPLLCWHVLSLK